MQDPMIIDLSETAFAELVALAKQNNISHEDQAAMLLQEHLTQEHAASEGYPDAKVARDAEHPDLQQINDWLLNGPKDAWIEQAVRELTLGHGMRLADVEGLILSTLNKLRQSLLDDSTVPDHPQSLG
jgi:hypothetical protein